MEENMNENGKKIYEENTEDMNREHDLLDSPSINDPYDDLEDEAEVEEKQENSEEKVEEKQKEETSSYQSFHSDSLPF